MLTKLRDIVGYIFGIENKNFIMTDENLIYRSNINSSKFSIRVRHSSHFSSYMIEFKFNDFKTEFILDNITIQCGYEYHIRDKFTDFFISVIRDIGLHGDLVYFCPKNCYMLDFPHEFIFRCDSLQYRYYPNVRWVFEYTGSRREFQLNEIDKVLKREFDVLSKKFNLNEKCLLQLDNTTKRIQYKDLYSTEKSFINV